ncbi:MAG TPA: GTPase Era [Terriglobales bacterium]|jgi:GTP-binding protein Era
MAPAKKTKPAAPPAPSSDPRERPSEKRRPPFHSGFATLVGRPNTGKSTLLNALLGRKLAIVTPHPQTTRTHLLGILNIAASAAHPAGQIVLVDTPGVHRGRGHLSRSMARSVRTGLEGRDLSLLLADVTRPFGAEDQLALDMLRAPNEETPTPAFLLLNKIDRLPHRNDILPTIDAWRARYNFAEILPISALHGANLELLIAKILALLPPGPEYFSPEQATDQPEHFLIAEIIREQAMLQTQAEVPHTLAVRIEADESKAQRLGTLRVLTAALYCERPGQKAILIGREGEMIRRIGTAARHELEAVLDTRVFLELRVLVRSEWRQDPRFLAGLDFRREL